MGTVAHLRLGRVIRVPRDNGTAVDTGELEVRLGVRVLGIHHGREGLDVKGPRGAAIVEKVDNVAALGDGAGAEAGGGTGDGNGSRDLVREGHDRQGNGARDLHGELYLDLENE